ncbi:MAG: ShlB/FhaC/HecB family hemolysin secretion/activation protein [Flavobacteriales bacterium]|nr:ShlB/FhaC/HecB family hemolysin secretion/activation protein [Flavobacteriales bacterium]
MEFGTDDAAHRELEKKTFATRIQSDAALLHYYSELVADGFLDARLDTSFRNDTLFIGVNAGRKFTWQNLTLSGTGNLKLRGKNTIRAGEPFSSGAIHSSAQQMLSGFENSGFPFAGIAVSKLEISDTLLSASLDALPGPYITWDSLAVKSIGGISGKYIRNYIGFRKGEAYNESWLTDLEKRLKEIPFVKVSRSPEVLFRKEAANLYLYLEKKRANYFNGVLGLQPNEATQKINVTGDVEVKLVNALSGGEEFYLNWRKLQSQTQDLTVNATIPYIFNLPIGTEGALKIYRRDTTFSSVKSSLALIHTMRGTNQVKAFVEKNSTNRLSAFLAAGLADVSSTLYGLGLRIEELDYKLNPRKGFGFSTEAAAGRKSASTHQTGDLITGLAEYNHYRVSGQVEFFIPTFDKQAIRIATQGATQISDVIYENEMYRIGGLRTLRGMDEESINASSWSVLTAEYRLLPEENSTLYLFADYGWYEYKGVDRFATDTPLGIGAGVNFETGTGIFTLNYALGQQFDNPVLLRNGKVSFGFRSIF